MKNNDELIIITKTYDLILWSCHHTSRFPRNHRFVLGERIERNLYGLLETLIQAKYSKDRRHLLEDADLNLEILRFPMRLAKDSSDSNAPPGHLSSNPTTPEMKVGGIPCSVPSPGTSSARSTRW